MVNPLYSLGKIVGSGIQKSNFIQKRISHYKIHIRGVGNLRETPCKTTSCKTWSCILASNHVRPLDGGLYKTGIAPDSFIIKNIILKLLSKETSIVMGFGIRNYKITKLFENFTRGLIIGLNSIAVKAGDKDSFKNHFLKGTEKAVSDNRVILIHPVGKYHDDFEKHHEIKAGAAYIALKYDLPIVPVYIKGCTHWNKKGQKVDISFGKPIEPKGTIDEINKKIRERILNLKNRN